MKKSPTASQARKGPKNREWRRTAATGLRSASTAAESIGQGAGQVVASLGGGGSRRRPRRFRAGRPGRRARSRRPTPPGFAGPVVAAGDASGRCRRREARARMYPRSVANSSTTPGSGAGRVPSGRGTCRLARVRRIKTSGCPSSVNRRRTSSAIRSSSAGLTVSALFRTATHPLKRCSSRMTDQARSSQYFSGLKNVEHQPRGPQQGPGGARGSRWRRCRGPGCRPGPCGVIPGGRGPLGDAWAASSAGRPPAVRLRW